MFPNMVGKHKHLKEFLKFRERELIIIKSSVCSKIIFKNSDLFRSAKTIEILLRNGDAL